MNALHLVSLPLALGPLRRWAATRGFGADEGVALHHLLSETFGKGAMQPFRMMPAPKATSATLYAYARADEACLRQTARECAMPDALAVCNLDGLATKPMPETWRKGRRLAFDLRVRPTKRLLKPAGVFAKGAEIDAYLVEALRLHPDGRPDENPVERETVYRNWLAERLGAAANLEEARMIRFERRPITRGKTSREGPDVIWHGELTVQDGDAFATRLGSGVGRHAAFGYGMLLLRPAR
ncbi:type I-E CRISPR-associated protein Cas6/Cse3/CasE [Rhodoblastus acidophilus]|uniref:Type I-E CRISPR-associated protein Cas6/Cse3/CasE n=1 Tax=Rhodoblastus acidophilus TaxID=1074 RepID=A0A6N8DR78_RHOAC|nr:type I-E CRISPR-associated protein Cas6/Cse3/CasE [Rhodoblastus acidophilus]MCW2274729.1 CRISPR system Cascade subunit CasE [Rhodoblastus acidophilus]MTV31681.1 type I-E CRISPR-associated protein Cas6/Cse3/CasE [Rhodoblastus acidophilus]